VQRVAFIGSKPLGLAVLRAVADALPEPHELVGAICAEDHRDRRSKLGEFADFLDSRGVELVVAGTTTEALKALRSWRTSVAVVCGWYRILPVGEVEGCDFYGLHASSLPRYRGYAPVVWQIIQGEPRIGLSFFKLDDGLDSGEVVAQVSFELSREQGVGDALQSLEIHAVNLVREHLPLLLEGTATLRGQNHALATYCGPRRPEDGVIDWNWPATRIHDFVRAQSRPYPGAFAWLGDSESRCRVIVWRTVIHAHPYVGVPGRMARVAPGEVIVACGSGAVRLLEVQIEDERPISGDELYATASSRAGSVLLS
jgi:methionyl-tRNA formyltransferase